MTDLSVAFAALQTVAAECRALAGELSAPDTTPPLSPASVGHARLAWRLEAETADLGGARRGIAMHLAALADGCTAVCAALADTDLRLAGDGRPSTRPAAALAVPVTSAVVPWP